GSSVKVKGITITGPPQLAVNPRPAAQGVRVTDTLCGIFNDESNDANLLVKLSMNTISNHSEGIELTNANCTKLQDNTVFNNNSDAVENHGIILENSSHNK